MEAVAAAAAIIALAQATDRIIDLCKFFIESAREDAPAGLRAILVELSGLKSILETLDFIRQHDNSVFRKVCSVKESPIEGCSKCMAELEKLLPSEYIQGYQSHKGKRSTVLAMLAWPLKEKKAEALLNQIARHKNTISLALMTDLTQDIKNITQTTKHISNVVNEEQRQALYKWLECTDPSPIHNQAEQDREPSTCDWACRRPEWDAWLNQNERCLWFYGIPGAGKTILLSHLFNQASMYPIIRDDPLTLTVYYYCYFGRRHAEAAPFLTWLISQLCRSRDTIHEDVYQLYRRGTTPNLAELLSVLATVIDTYKFSYVFIDAIDESEEQDDLLSVLRTLVTDPRFQKIGIMATSREHANIKKVMSYIGKPIPMDSPSVREDIGAMVSAALRSNSDFNRWPETLRNEVEQILPVRAEGMFRWAVCQLDLLRRLKPEPRFIQKTLASLPGTIFATYDRIMTTMGEEDSTIVYHTLNWISLSSDNHVHLSTQILTRAVGRSIAVLSPQTSHRLVDLETIQRLCGCLVRLSPVSGVAELAHFTVREYLDLFQPTSISIGNSTEETNLSFATIALCDSQVNIYGEFDGTWPDFEPWEYFEHFCLELGSKYISRNADVLIAHDPLFESAVSFLDPSKSHFRYVEQFAREEYLATYYLFATEDISPRNLRAYQLLVFILTVATYSYESLENPIAKFLRGSTTRQIFQPRLKLRVSSEFLVAPGTDNIVLYQLEGPLAEICPYYRWVMPIDFILKLLHIGNGYFDATEVLLIITTMQDAYSRDELTMLLETLLKAGANTNAPEHFVTPLQVACYFRNPFFIRKLLQSGADVRGTGSPTASAWDDSSPFSHFNKLHARSPLSIIRDAELYNDRVLILEREFGDSELTEDQLESFLLEYVSEEIATEGKFMSN